LDVYAGPGTVLTGSARLAQEARDRQAELEKTQASAFRHRELQQEREQLQAQFCAIQERLRGLSEELSVVAGQEIERLSAAKEERRKMVAARRAD